MTVALRNRLTLIAAVVAVSSAIGVTAWNFYADQKAKEAKEKKCLQMEAQLEQTIIKAYASSKKGLALEKQSGQGSIQYTILLPAIEDNLNAMSRLREDMEKITTTYAKECGETRKREWYKNNFERLRQAGDPSSN